MVTVKHVGKHIVITYGESLSLDDVKQVFAAYEAMHEKIKYLPRIHDLRNTQNVYEIVQSLRYVYKHANGSQLSFVVNTGYQRAMALLTEAVIDKQVAIFTSLDEALNQQQ